MPKSMVSLRRTSVSFTGRPRCPKARWSLCETCRPFSQSCKAPAFAFQPWSRTGMRLGEVLALRWNRTDLDAKVIQVREALEQTRAYGTRFKAPKSRADRRDITLPDVLVDVLREHRKAA